MTLFSVAAAVVVGNASGCYFACHRCCCCYCSCRGMVVEAYKCSDVATLQLSDLVLVGCDLFGWMMSIGVSFDCLC